MWVLVNSSWAFVTLNNTNMSLVKNSVERILKISKFQFQKLGIKDIT